jgi:2-dehydropantoate 2-reductase
MRIAVIGAGGVGGTLGGALQRSGQDVWYLARGRQLEAMRERGLRITGARGDYRLARVQATDDPALIGPVEAVLLAVKLWDVETAVRALGPLMAADTVVVTLQNGVDAPDQAASAIGAARVAAGSCFVNAGITDPGVIVQTSAQQRIVAGMMSGARSATLGRLGSACAAAGIELDFAADPVGALWEKYVQLVPTSAMTALLRAPIGVVRDDAESWRLFLQLLEETVRVGRAAGVEIPPATVERRLAYVGAMPADATASMAKDLMRGRRLELPWLSGRVAELGRRHGVPTPANDFVWVALKPFISGTAADPWQTCLGLP